MLKGLLCALLLLLALSTAAAPQQEQADIVDELAGDRPRVWVYGGFSSYSAGERDGACKGSDTWAFYSDNRLVIRKCRKKRLVIEEKRWSVQTKPHEKAVLMIDDDEAYDLRFENEETPSKRVKMTLTRRDAPKSEPTQELLFYRFRGVE